MSTDGFIGGSALQQYRSIEENQSHAEAQRRREKKKAKLAATSSFS
jgi:hypothetical protein